MATKVAEGTAEFSANVQPAKDAYADMVAAARQAAEQVIDAEELTEGARRRAAERRIKMVERALERQVIAEEKAAVRAAKAVEREAERKIRAEERAARASAAAASKSASSWTQAFRSLNQNQLISEAETLSAMFIQVGGGVSQLASIVTSAIRPVAAFASTVGGVALAVAAIPAAGAAAAYAIKAIADAGVEARDRLDEMGRGALVSHEARVALGEYETATRELSVAVDELTVQFGAQAAPAATKFATALRLLAGGKPEVLEMLRESGNDGRMLSDVMEYLADRAGRAGRAIQELSAIIVTGGAYLLMDDVNASIDEFMGKKSQAASQEEQQRRDQTEFVAVAIREAEEEEKARSDSAKRTAALIARLKREEEEAERKRLAAAKAARTAQEAADRARLAARQRIFDLDAKIERAMKEEADAREEIRKNNLAFAEQVDLLRQIGVNADWANAQIADMAAQKPIDDMKARVGELAEKLAVVGQVVQGLGMIFSEVLTAQVDAANAWDERLQKTLGNERRVNAEIKRLHEQLAQADNRNSKNAIQNQLSELESEKGVIEKRKENREKQYELHARLARRAFVADKAAALSQIAINTAVAIMQAYASLPTPAAIVASIGIGALGAAEAGIVAAKKPPEYPMGLSGTGGSAGPGTSPDHTVVRAMTPEEMIVSARGREDRDVVRMANEGRNGGRGDVFVLEVNGREVAAAESSGRRVKVDARAGKVSRRGGWQ